MIKNWKSVKLGDLCDLLNGNAFKSKDYVKASNTLNIRMSNTEPLLRLNALAMNQIELQELVEHYLALINEGQPQL